MEVRPARPKEEKVFLELERKAIYPKLLAGAMRRWVEGQDPPYAPLLFVLEEAGQIVGGAVVEIQDFFDDFQPMEIILQLDALFIVEGYRRRGLGTRLLREGISAARGFYQSYGLKAVGLIIQTTSLDEGAAEFYRRALAKTGFTEASQGMGSAAVTVFLVPFK